MADKDYTLTEDEALATLALRRGYVTVRRYLIDLIERDAEQHGEPRPVLEDDDELDDPVENLKQALLDVKHGRVMSWEEFERKMREDAG